MEKLTKLRQRMLKAEEELNNFKKSISIPKNSSDTTNIFGVGENDPIMEINLTMDNYEEYQRLNKAFEGALSDYQNEYWNHQNNFYLKDNSNAPLKEEILPPPAGVRLWENKTTTNGENQIVIPEYNSPMMAKVNATKLLLNDIISWEKDTSEYESLEAVLNEKYIIKLRT